MMKRVPKGSSRGGQFVSSPKSPTVNVRLFKRKNRSLPEPRHSGADNIQESSRDNVFSSSEFSLSSWQKTLVENAENRSDLHDFELKDLKREIALRQIRFK
jgi:hypothetical protein